MYGHAEPSTRQVSAGDRRERDDADHEHHRGGRLGLARPPAEQHVARAVEPRRREGEQERGHGHRATLSRSRDV